MDKLTIGQMAKLNNVSERALRIYHDMELLVPMYVDENTSYRYYSARQSRRLNMILQMKSVGFSLKEIKEIIDRKDPLSLEALLHKQIEAVNVGIHKLQLKENTLYRMLESCKNFQNPPQLGNLFIEHQRTRRAYFFAIEPFDYVMDHERYERSWDKVLEKVKKTILDNNMPISYFRDVGCIVRYENLISNRLICDGAFIIPPERLKYTELPSYELHSGTYACMSDRWLSGDSQAEARGITKLLAYIKEKGIEICGDYIAEVAAESSVFDADSSLSLIKMQIPVRLL